MTVGSLRPMCCCEPEACDYCVDWWSGFNYSAAELSQAALQRYIYIYRSPVSQAISRPDQEYWFLEHVGNDAETSENGIEVTSNYGGVPIVSRSFDKANTSTYDPTSVDIIWEWRATLHIAQGSWTPLPNASDAAKLGFLALTYTRTGTVQPFYPDQPCCPTFVEFERRDNEGIRRLNVAFGADLYGAVFGGADPFDRDYVLTHDWTSEINEVYVQIRYLQTATSWTVKIYGHLGGGYPSEPLITLTNDSDETYETIWPLFETETVGNCTYLLQGLGDRAGISQVPCQNHWSTWLLAPGYDPTPASQSRATISHARGQITA